MKKHYIFLILMICSGSFAQDSRIFGNYWHLRNVIRDGADHFPPRPMGLEFYSETDMVVHGCLPMIGTVNFENNQSNFTGTNFQLCLCWCNDFVAEAYENIYFPFFIQGNFDPESVKSFTYSIVESDDEKMLTISSNNEQAIYSNIQLANPGFEKLNFSISPNPAADFIVIKSDHSHSGTTSVEFYDALGKICRSEQFTDGDMKIETRNLSRGLYIVKIKNGNETTTKKFMKL
jgi:hypothetical protein